MPSLPSNLFRRLSAAVLAVFFIVSLTGLARAASPAVDFAAPLDWIKIDSGPGVDAFQTSFDDEQKFIVLVRFVDTAPMTVEEWVRAEIETMMDEKGTVFADKRPKEERWGDLDWVTLEWDSPKTEEHGKQFYLEYGARNLVEVSIAAKAEVYDRAGLVSFGKFLKSFRIPATINAHADPS